MKQKLLLFTACAAFIYLTFSSNASGPAAIGNGDKTGRIVPSQTCSTPGCHGTGAPGTTCSIEVRRKEWGATSTPVNGFLPGKTYLVTIKGTHPSLSKF